MTSGADSPVRVQDTEPRFRVCPAFPPAPSAPGERAEFAPPCNDSCALSQAEERLRHTLAADKNEILFSEFGINYNDEPALYRKGTVIVRSLESPGDDSSNFSSDVSAPDGCTVPAAEESDRPVQKPVGVVKVLNCDIIGDDFWNEHSSVLSGNNKKAR